MAPPYDTGEKNWKSIAKNVKLYKTRITFNFKSEHTKFQVNYFLLNLQAVCCWYFILYPSLHSRVLMQVCLQVQAFLRSHIHIHIHTRLPRLSIHTTIATSKFKGRLLKLGNCHCRSSGPRNPKFDNHIFCDKLYRANCNDKNRQTQRFCFHTKNLGKHDLQSSGLSWKIGPCFFLEWHSQIQIMLCEMGRT